jgi:hypothetical protein
MAQHDRQKACCTSHVNPPESCVIRNDVQRVLGEIMMSRFFSRARVTAAIYFIVGFLCSPVVIGVWKAHYVLPGQDRQRAEAYSFFYRTMIELFAGIYNPESGFVSEDALNDYKKYADRLGDMCQVHLGKDSAGNFVGQAFFPSGDVFDIEVFRSNKRLKLTNFFHRNWESVWRDALDWYGVSTMRQHQLSPPGQHAVQGGD